MKWIRLRSSDEKYFNQAWAIYEQSFPVFEQRLLRDQQAAMKDEEFYFIAIVEEERVIAIVGYWIYPQFIYIEHLAVHPEVRGQKLEQKYYMN
ncbi:MAG: GNAT family N-acetyltransferase [Thomasclavelia ramosa]